MKKFVLPSLILTVVLVTALLAWDPGPRVQATAPSLNEIRASNAALDYYGYVYYTVRPGDYLASIAREFCTSWQVIYDLNRNVIGPDPDHVVPDMVLVVPAACNGGGGGCAGVFDRGWLPHAQGYVIPPNQYRVAKGDTWYSIGKRFGVSVRALQRANRQYYPYAFTTVRIPCLNAGPIPAPPIYPPITPQPPPTVTPPPAVIAYVTIDFPPANAVLPNAFTVSGRGGGLPEGNVVVRVKDAHGNVLVEQATALQGENVGVGGEGTWSVDLTIPAPSTTNGVIEASSPGTGAFASVPVFFQNGGAVDYPPGQCQVQVSASTRAFDAPNGSYLGNFSGDGAFEANRREQVNGENWYRLPIQVGDNPAIWVKAGELAGVTAGCN